MKKRMAENSSNAESQVEEFYNGEEDVYNSNTATNVSSTPSSTSGTPIKSTVKKPKSTRVKVGHKNTEAIDPKYIKSVADWVAYSDRGNVIQAADGTLQVRGEDGSIKTIPFQKGFDAIRGINMRSDILRKKSADHLAFLQQQRRINLSRLQDEFVEKERELLDGTRTFRESVSGDADGSLAADVVRLNKELSAIHARIQDAKYSFQTPVGFTVYPRYQINYASHDDRTIFLNENMNMETTTLMRTLGLDGEPLPEVEDAEEIEEDEEEINDITEENSNENGNENENVESSVVESNIQSDNDPYFEELINEIKSKLETYVPPPNMTLGQLKAAIFTEERLAYYNAHIPDFKKRFGEAYVKAIEN
jgi:hypothetical protein